jgi:hypothetical protein
MAVLPRIPGLDFIGGGKKPDLSPYLKKSGGTMSGILKGIGFVNLAGLAVTYDDDGYVETITSSGRTITFTYNDDKMISSFTDEVNTWTVNYTDNRITSIAVS